MIEFPSTHLPPIKSATSEVADKMKIIHEKYDY